MRMFFAKRAGTAGGHRPIIVALACSAVLLAAGCSALKFSYGHAADLGYWWADKYVDFDETQAPQVRSALLQWFAWHRASQLPDYAQQLARAQAEIQQPVSAEQACRWAGLFKSRADAAFAQALPAMARLALELKPEQLHNMARRFDKLNAEYHDEWLTEPLHEQHRIAAKKLRERYEMLYGSLEKPQRHALDAAAVALPISAAAWDAERRHRQQDTLATLRRIVGGKAGAEAAQQELQALYERAKASPRPVYLALQQQTEQAHCELFAQLHALSTPRQRQEAVKKLRSWQDDARSLAAEAPMGAASQVSGLWPAWVQGSAT